MTTPVRDFRLIHRNYPGKLESEADLKAAIAKVSPHKFDSLILELWYGKPPADADRVFYWLMGQKLPTPCCLLTVFWNGDWAQVVFEDGDNKWHALESSPTETDETVDLKTQGGYWFTVPVSACVRRTEAFDLLLEFYQSRTKPTAKWRRPETPA